MPDPTSPEPIDQLLDLFSTLNPDSGPGKLFLDKLTDLTNIGMSKGFEKFSQAANLSAFGLNQAGAAASTFQSRPGLENEILKDYTDLVGTRLLLRGEEATLGRARFVAKTLSEQFSSQAMGIQNEIQKFSGMNSLAVDSFAYGAETIARKATDSGFQMMYNLEQHQVKMRDGVSRSVSELNLEPAKATFARFNETLLKDTRLTYATIGAMTENVGDDIALSMLLSQERLHVSIDDLNEIFQVELSETGKISGKYLEEQQKVALAASRIYGANMLQVTADINTMMGDFEHFGTKGQDELGALSVVISQLGLRINDVTSMASKFSSFDSAIQTVSNLSAATGASLEGMKLFELSAAGDIQGFVEELREELEASGLDFESMDLPMQKYIARQLSIDPRVLQRLMNDNIEVMETSADELGKAVSDITSEDLTASLVGMARTGLDIKTPEDIAKVQLENININKETALTIENVYNVSQTQMLKSYKIASDNLGKQEDSLKRMLTTINDIVKNMATGQNNDYLISALTTTPAVSTAGAITPSSPVGPTPSAAAAPVDGGTTSTAAATSAATPTNEIALSINLAGSPEAMQLMNLLGLNFSVNNGDLTFVHNSTRYTIKTDNSATSP